MLEGTIQDVCLDEAELMHAIERNDVNSIDVLVKGRSGLVSSTAALGPLIFRRGIGPYRCRVEAHGSRCGGYPPLCRRREHEPLQPVAGSCSTDKALHYSVSSSYS